MRITGFVLAAAIVSGAAAAQAPMKPEPMTQEEVSRAAKEGVEFAGNAYILERRAANPDLLLIDLRSEEEFELGHIPGAVSIPRGVAEFRIAKDVRDADAEIILYCATGNRAALVKKALDSQGYRNVSAHEGFDHWAEAGESIENEYGTFTLISRAEKE